MGIAVISPVVLAKAGLTPVVLADPVFGVAA
jgi:hypothetical protein